MSTAAAIEKERKKQATGYRGCERGKLDERGRHCAARIPGRRVEEGLEVGAAFFFFSCQTNKAKPKLAAFQNQAF